MGPDWVYEEVQISKVTTVETPHALLFSECVAWLQGRKSAGLGGKKFALFEDAQQRFGAGLSHAMFDAAYLSVFDRKRGRPKNFRKSKH